MSYNAIFNGTPSQYPAGSDTIADGVDTNTGAEWNTATGGWAPQSNAFAKDVQLGLAGEAANYVVTAPKSGMYRVDAYEITTVATSGDMPAVAVAFTDADTGGSATVTFVTATSGTAAANTVNQGSVLINAKAGTTITLSTSGYATLTYNIKYRVSSLG